MSLGTGSLAVAGWRAQEWPGPCSQALRRPLSAGTLAARPWPRSARASGSLVAPPSRLKFRFIGALLRPAPAHLHPVTKLAGPGAASDQSGLFAAVLGQETLGLRAQASGTFPPGFSLSLGVSQQGRSWPPSWAERVLSWCLISDAAPARPSFRGLLPDPLVSRQRRGLCRARPGTLFHPPSDLRQRPFICFLQMKTD